MTTSTASPRQRLLSARGVAWIASGPMLFGLIIFAVYPFFYLIGLAFTDSGLARPLQEWSGLTNFNEALNDGRYVRSLLRSVVMAFLSTAIAMVLGVAVAMLLDKAVRARDMLRTLILLPLLTPPVTVAIMWQLILMPSGGLLNGVLLDLSIISAPLSFLGVSSLAFASVILADVWQWTPFVALMAFASIQTLPSEVYEAADLEVRSKWMIFRHVTLPMLLPSLIGIAVLKLIISFKVFDLVFVLTAGGPGESTTLTSYQIYRVAIQQFDIGVAAAMTLLFAIVVGLATVPFTVSQNKVEERFG